MRRIVSFALLCAGFSICAHGSKEPTDHAALVCSEEEDGSCTTMHDSDGTLVQVAVKARSRAQRQRVHLDEDMKRQIRRNYERKVASRYQRSDVGSKRRRRSWEGNVPWDYITGTCPSASFSLYAENQYGQLSTYALQVKSGTSDTVECDPGQATGVWQTWYVVGVEWFDNYTAVSTNCTYPVWDGDAVGLTNMQSKRYISFDTVNNKVASVSNQLNFDCTVQCTNALFIINCPGCTECTDCQQGVTVTPTIEQNKTSLGCKGVEARWLNYGSGNTQFVTSPT